MVAEGGAVDVDGASALLEPCLEAVAAGDGRELWQFEGAGAIQSAVGKTCLQVRSACAVSGCTAAARGWAALRKGCTGTARHPGTVCRFLLAATHRRGS